MLLFASQLFAQTQANSAMQSIHNNGKIYVVVAVILIILIGLLVYLFAMDKRIKMLEKKSNIKN
ncbi:MAG: CcmD family protein [Flavobacterium sp.]|nr:MAG: CcmD family protein [Flavobacterium sp.]